jgi:hypothetical protein
VQLNVIREIRIYYVLEEECSGDGEDRDHARHNRSSAAAVTALSGDALSSRCWRSASVASSVTSSVTRGRSRSSSGLPRREFTVIGPVVVACVLAPSAKAPEMAALLRTTSCIAGARCVVVQVRDLEITELNSRARVSANQQRLSRLTSSPVPQLPAGEQH